MIDLTGRMSPATCGGKLLRLFGGWSSVDSMYSPEDPEIVASFSRYAAAKKLFQKNCLKAASSFLMVGGDLGKCFRRSS
ncbi:hypothetical protein C5167_046911 [Papaver somniferum]|uniref:Uncharacterized protein n=1 Tax=Papaver somniferum TaxID=3469 RepID=A0A4Y7LJ32_PAPSO|nr:hypothetical protein C5167_046911 [Papaver somniferum]